MKCPNCLSDLSIRHGYILECNKYYCSSWQKFGMQTLLITSKKEIIHYKIPLLHESIWHVLIGTSGSNQTYIWREQMMGIDTVLKMNFIPLNLETNLPVEMPKLLIKLLKLRLFT